MNPSRRQQLLALLLLSLALAVIFTWPLAGHYFSSIPYSFQPLEGYQQVPLMPGDHLQSYYWFWIFSDNLLGASHLFTNPYEFNAGAVRLVSQYVNFPLSALWALFLPLGPAGAYNSLVVLSFVFAALAGWLLARSLLDDPWAALLAGALLAMAPARVSSAVAGQMFGLVWGMLPLCLYCAEKSLARRSWRWGLAAGACPLLLSIMEPHITYFLTLTLGLYLPGRLLLGGERPPLEAAGGAGPAGRGDAAPPRGGVWPELACVLLAGLALALFSGLHLARQQPPVSGPFWAQALILWPLAALAGWLVLSALAARLTSLEFAQARRRVALAGLAWTPLLLYAVQLRLDIPHLGGLLGGGCALLFLAALAKACWPGRLARPGLNWRGLGALLPGLALGLGVGAAYLIHVRATKFLGSIAGKGRGLGEISLFSPHPEGLFRVLGGPDEHFVVLGWVALGLGLLACLPLLGPKPRRAGLRALALLMVFLGAVLALGPTLPGFALYNLLYDHLPFFKYPRVSGRYVIVALTFLGLLAGLGLADLRRWLLAKGRARAARLAPLAALVLLAVQYHGGQAIGLCLFPPSQSPVYQALAQAPKDLGLVLELPLWPGDSHQSSSYEYTVTRTRRPMVNGYSPVVSRQYVDEVFWPLYPLDLGQLGADQARTLRELKVGLVTFHDDALIYPEKVSPFPPRLALKRLEASGWLKPLAQDGVMHLFALRDRPLMAQTPPEAITSPVCVPWQAQDLRPGPAGQYGFDPQASGYSLLLLQDAQGRVTQELDPRARGNLIGARPGLEQAGLLASGPGRSLPPGDYLARFRLRLKNPLAGPQAGRLEVAQAGQAAPLAARPLLAGDFPAPGQWVDLALPFRLETTTPVETRVFSAAGAPLELNLVLVGFAGMGQGPGSWESEDLLRQTGAIDADPKASGGLAVHATAGLTPPLYIQHGPYQTLEPGRYRALFHLRRGTWLAGGPSGQVALLEVALDKGRRVLGSQRLSADRLGDQAYAAVVVDFDMPFRSEIDLRVRYLGGCDLWADRVEVFPLEAKP